jgi:hypothetical protein
VAFFREAAARLNLPQPRVIAYEDLLGQDCPIPLLDHVNSGSLVRVESPGENAVVEAALIRRGALLEGASLEEAEQYAATAQEHGRIAYPRLWYLGYCDLLAAMARALAAREVHWMNHPAEIPLLFDKAACLQRLAALGIPTPPAIEAGQGSFACYDDVRAALDAAGVRRAFVKLRYGSSASGVVALARAPGRVRATTSAQLVREADEIKLYNSLRLREYSDEREVAAIIDQLCRHEIHVEQWLPKADFQGRVFDLRVLVIAGRPRHVVLRTSRGPITNLHLGNQRGDLDSLLERWPAEAREAAWQSCRLVATAFPQSRYFGVDLLLLPGLKRHAILETNAYGDLLPGVFHEGDDTYTAELRSYLSR